MPLPITPGFAYDNDEVTLWTNDTGASTDVEVRLLLPTVTDTRKIDVQICVYDDGSETSTVSKTLTNATGSDRVTVTVADKGRVQAKRIASQEKRFMKFRISSAAAQADSDGGESA